MTAGEQLQRDARRAWELHISKETVLSALLKRDYDDEEVRRTVDELYLKEPPPLPVDAEDDKQKNYGFPKYRYSDLLHFKPDPTSYIMGDGWLKPGAGTLLIGGTGLGKSVMAEQMAVCVSAGIPFFGIETRQPHRTLYLSAENDIEVLQQDFLSIRKHVSGKPCPVILQGQLAIYCCYGMRGQAFATWLEARITSIRAEFLVIDPYQAFLGGAADINNSTTVFELIRPLEVVLKKYGCAVLLVMHTTKPRDRMEWTARESVYTAAGSSAISNWARTSCELTEVGDFDGRFRLRFSKNAERTGLVDKNGRTIRDLFLAHSDNRHEPYWRLAGNQTEPSKFRNDAKILDYVDKHPDTNQRRVAAACEVSVSTVNACLTRKRESLQT